MADLDLPKLERPEGVEGDGRGERSYSDVHAESQDRATEAHPPGGSLPPIITKTINDAPLVIAPRMTPLFKTAQGDHQGEGQTDDPHDTAAMALAVLSSGVGIQGAAPFYPTGQGEEPRETRMDQSIGHCGNDTLSPGSRIRRLSPQSQSRQKQQRRYSTGDLDEESRISEGQTQSSSSDSRSGMPRSPTVEHLNPLNIPQHPLTASTPPPKATIKLGKLNEQVEEHGPQASGFRMQSLSHLLRARLSLTSFRTDRHRDNLVEDSVTLDRDRQDHLQGRGPVLVRSPHTLSRHHQELAVTPFAASLSYKRATYHREDEGSYVHFSQYTEETLGRDRVPHFPQGRVPPVTSFREPQPTSEDRPMSPLPVYSPTMESVHVKPKRKYTKKTSVSQLGLSGAGRVLMEGIPAVPESELLQSDRGLVLKTQIPKKGRPISKHPSTASQSTPTLSSFGVLPASHPYFSSSKAAGVPFVVSPSPLGVNTSLSSRNTYVGRPPELHHVHSSAQDDSHHRHLSQAEQQMQAPVRRKPGRPPLASTVARHSHSQSHSSLQSGPLSASPGPLYLTGRSQSFMGYSQRSSSDVPHHSAINRGAIADYDDEPFVSSSFIHYRDPSPPVSVASSSTVTSYQQGPAKRHSYPLSMEQRQHEHGYEYQQRRSSYRLVESPTEIEHRTPRDQTSSSPQEYGREVPSGLVRSFAEGYTPQQVGISSISSGRKRSSSGATKEPSERPSTDTGGPQYDDDGRAILNFFDEAEQSFQHDLRSEGTRARKRISRPDSGSVDSGEFDRQGESDYRSSWAASFPERRGRPRSSTTLSMQGRGHGPSFRERSPIQLRHPPRDVHPDQEHTSYRQRGGHQAHYHSHAHSRSLDLSFVNRQTTATQGRQHHMASEEVIESRGLSPGGRGSLMSPPSVSPPFPPIIRTGIRQQRSRQEQYYESYQEAEMPLPPTGMAKTTMAHMLARQMSNSASSSRVLTSPLGTSTSRMMLAESSRGRSAGQVMKTVPKRSTKKGLGPHLKKHQILQQQLHQMQQEQEELEIQRALRQQQQEEEEESISTKPLTMHKQRPYAKFVAPPPPPEHHHHGAPQIRHHSHPYHPQQPQPGRPPKQRVLMRSESASSVLRGPLSPQYQSRSGALSQSQSQLQLRPQHSSYASSIGSGRGVGGGSGSGVSSTNTPSPSSTAASKRRQNQQQTILLRPVSLPMFVGHGGGAVDDSGSPISISSSSTSSTGRMTGQFYHSQGGPPPGQPLYRSLPALSPLSPYQLTPVSMQASSSTSMAPGSGTERESGSGQISGSKFSHPRHHRSAEHSSSEDRTSTVQPSPRSSPSVSLASPQSVGGTAMSSGPSSSRSDIHGYGSASHYHHQHPPQSQPSYRSRVSSASVSNLGSTSSGGGHSMSRSTSLSLDAALASKRTGEMSASSSSSTLFHQDTDMSTSSSLTSLSSLSSLATLNHRHSQSSFSTTSLSSSSFHQEQQQQQQQRPHHSSSSTSSTPYHGKAPSDSPQQQQRPSQTMEDMGDPRSMEPPSSIASHHYHHYHTHHHQNPNPSYTAMAKTGSSGRPPLPPVTYPPRSTTPTPASTPTPTLGSSLVRTEE